MIYEFGSEEDVSNENEYSKNTVVLKVNGNLTIKEQVTITSVLGNRGGPKGMIIYCTGTLLNDGNISMSEKGGYAPGQNFYMFKNSNNTYEFVPELGALGGDGGSYGRMVSGIDGPKLGANGVGRATGRRSEWITKR